MGRSPDHQHGGAPQPASGAGGVGVVGRGSVICHRSAHSSDAVRVRCGVWRRQCSPTPLSTGPLKRGTLARSPEWMCAAKPTSRAGGEGLGWLTRGRYVTTLQHALSVRVPWCGSENVPYDWLFQPARGSVGRWSSHQNGCAPPPMPGGVVAGGRSVATGRHTLCACGAVCAGNVLLRGRFQPACGSVGRWSGHQNGCAPATCVRSQKRG